MDEITEVQSRNEPENSTAHPFLQDHPDVCSNFLSVSNNILRVDLNEHIVRQSYQIYPEV